MTSRDMLTAVYMAKRWIAACPAIENATDLWKSDLIGRSGCIFCSGVAYEKARLAIMRSHEDAIICRSDERAPSSESAEKTKAEIVLSSIMICCCCSAESSVHRPCRIRSTMCRTDGWRDVNGAATDASPGRTIGRPDSCSSAAVAEPPGPAPAAAFMLS